MGYMQGVSPATLQGWYLLLKLSSHTLTVWSIWRAQQISPRGMTGEMVEGRLGCNYLFMRPHIAPSYNCL